MPRAPPACLQHRVGRGRRCWYGIGPVCGVTGRARGHLVSPMTWLCYTDITAGEWHKDGCAGVALSLPRLWAVLHCPRLILGFCGAFGGSGKFKLPFLGRLDQKKAMVRLSRGCGYPGMQMLDLTTGRRAVASKYPPAIRPSVPVTCILVREIILHLSSYERSLGMRVTIGRLWAVVSKAVGALLYFYFTQSKAVGAARVCPPTAHGAAQQDRDRSQGQGRIRARRGPFTLPVVSER